MDYRGRYEAWLKDAGIDEETKAELIGIAEQDEEIKERFYKELDFGTGGLRGIVGAGSNRMNRYTVARATQGLANYIQKQGAQTAARGVAIAYDCRNKSEEFAQIAGLVLAGNGIPVFIYPSLRPTPMLSFAVRELSATAGIVVTASHNPPEYNGYKVYWDDGAQIPYPQDRAVMAEVLAVTTDGVRQIALSEAIEKGLYRTIEPSLEDAYYKKVLEQIQNKDVISQAADMPVVYTPLHGTGNLPVRRALREAGFENVIVVPEQELPDSHFSTVGYPNPEDPKVFKMGIALAKQVGAELILATDPDCDRLGVVAKNAAGEYEPLNGNEAGILLTEYILSQRHKSGTLPQHAAVIKTIVTTEMIRAICTRYKVALFDVLTGFKNIAAKMKELEESKSHQYVFGFEESYGYLAGTYARDKDAVVTALLFCEMAAYYRAQGLSLHEALAQLYPVYGYYADDIYSITLEGLAGLERIDAAMADLRASAPSEWGGIPVTWIRDYTKEEFSQIQNGDTEKNPLPPSNVLRYTLADDSWLCVRPSGTEPKLKFYIGTKGETYEEAKQKLQRLKLSLKERVQIG